MCELWVVFIHLIVLSGRNKWPKIENFLFVLQIFANSIAMLMNYSVEHTTIPSIRWVFLVFEEVNNDSNISKTLQLNRTNFDMSKLSFGLLRYWTIYLKHFLIVFFILFLKLKTTTSTKINLLSLPSQCKYTPKIELETRISQSLEYVRSRRTSTLDSIQATSKKRERTQSKQCCSTAPPK